MYARIKSYINNINFICQLVHQLIYGCLDVAINFHDQGRQLIVGHELLVGELACCLD